MHFICFRVDQKLLAATNKNDKFHCPLEQTLAKSRAVRLGEKHLRKSELQIIGGNEHNSKIIFLFLNKNICRDPSLGDGSNDGTQNMFYEVI